MNEGQKQICLRILFFVIVMAVIAIAVAFELKYSDSYGSSARRGHRIIAPFR